jgi:hypothetical protein
MARLSHPLQAAFWLLLKIVVVGGMRRGYILDRPVIAQPPMRKDATTTGSGRWPGSGAVGLLLLTLLSLSSFGCATIRVTDPPRSATEQFLLSEAAAMAISQLATEALLARRVYLDPTYLTAAKQPSQEHSFLLGELRAWLLLSGVQLVNEREEADIIMEVRSGGVGIDRLEYLLGIPSFNIAAGPGTAGAVPLATPELAILKSTRQRGFATVAFIAYWRDTGQVVASSGPHVGRTFRDDWWILGYGPRTSGNIPPTEQQ